MKYIQTIKAKSIMDRLSAMGVDVSGDSYGDYGFYVDQQIDSRFSVVRRVFVTDEFTQTLLSSSILVKPLKLNGKEIFPEGFPVSMLFPSKGNFLSEVNAQGDTLNGARIEGEFSNPDQRQTLFIFLELVN